MDFNFEKYVQGTRTRNNKLVVGKRLASLYEEKLSKNSRIDVYFDKINNAIKITAGSSLALSKSNAIVKSFCSYGLIKKGVKTGVYKHIGDGIFVKED